MEFPCLTLFIFDSPVVELDQNLIQGTLFVFEGPAVKSYSDYRANLKVERLDLDWFHYFLVSSIKESRLMDV
jgi:hypothetical protein